LGLIEELVLQSKVDVAVIIKPAFHPGLVCEPYREAKLVGVVSANHPLARREVIRRTNTRPSITMDLLRNEMGRQGLPMNIVLECDTPEGARAAVKLGLGLGFFFQELVERNIKRGRLKLIEIRGLNFNWTFKTYLIYHQERILSPIARDFLTLLRRWPRKSFLFVSLSHN